MNCINIDFETKYCISVDLPIFLCSLQQCSLPLDELTPAITR